MWTPGQLELLVSIGFQMNLNFAPLTLRMLVTMLRKAGTKSFSQLVAVLDESGYHHHPFLADEP